MELIPQTGLLIKGGGFGLKIWGKGDRGTMEGNAEAGASCPNCGIWRLELAGFEWALSGLEIRYGRAINKLNALRTNAFSCTVRSERPAVEAHSERAKKEPSSQN